jgi:hypothetical protein
VGGALVYVLVRRRSQKPTRTTTIDLNATSGMVAADSKEYPGPGTERALAYLDDPASPIEMTGARLGPSV